MPIRMPIVTNAMAEIDSSSHSGTSLQMPCPPMTPSAATRTNAAVPPAKTDQDAHHYKRTCGSDTQGQRGYDLSQELSPQRADQGNQGQRQTRARKDGPWPPAFADLCDHSQLGLVAKFGDKGQAQCRKQCAPVQCLVPPGQEVMLAEPDYSLCRLFHASHLTTHLFGGRVRASTG
jgi:hypothetical protein